MACLISEINRAERKWLLQSRGSASFLFIELEALGSEVMPFHITRGPVFSNSQGNPLSASQLSIYFRIVICAQMWKEAIEILFSLCFLIVNHQQCIENVLSSIACRHLQNCLLQSPVLTEIAIRWDGRDRDIT